MSDSQPSASKPLTFSKQMIKVASTTSLLTVGFKKSSPKPSCALPPKAAIEAIGKQLGFKVLNIEDLPEDAFETDSEDDE